eukprot:531734_1
MPCGFIWTTKPLKKTNFIQNKLKKCKQTMQICFECITDNDSCEWYCCDCQNMEQLCPPCIAKGYDPIEWNCMCRRCIRCVQNNTKCRRFYVIVGSSDAESMNVKVWLSLAF